MVDEVTVPRFAEEDIWNDTIPMLQNGWRPTGGPVNVPLDQGLLNWPLQWLTNRTRRLKNRIDNMNLKAGSLVTVGAGGTYATLNAALSDLSERRPAYAPGGFNTEVRLLAGYTMAEQVLVRGVNLGWLRITSEAAEVFIDRAYLTTIFGNCYPAFGVGDGGTLPNIATLFSMMATGAAADRVGVSARTGGVATVEGGAGVKNAGAQGLKVETSGAVAANSSIFSGAGAEAAYAAGGTRVAIESADLRNSTHGIFATNGASVHATSADCSGASVNGIRATRLATINARSANARRGASDQTTDFVVAEGGIIGAVGGTGGTSVTANATTVAGLIFK